MAVEMHSKVKENDIENENICKNLILHFSFTLDIYRKIRFCFY